MDLVFSIFGYSTGALNMEELNSYFPMAINAYINNDIGSFTRGQAPFVNLLLNKIKDIPLCRLMILLQMLKTRFRKQDFHFQNKTNYTWQPL